MASGNVTDPSRLANGTADGGEDLSTHPSSFSSPSPTQQPQPTNASQTGDNTSLQPSTDNNSSLLLDSVTSKSSSVSGGTDSTFNSSSSASVLTSSRSTGTGSSYDTTTNSSGGAGAWNDTSSSVSGVTDSSGGTSVDLNGIRTSAPNGDVVPTTGMISPTPPCNRSSSSVGNCSAIGNNADNTESTDVSATLVIVLPICFVIILLIIALVMSFICIRRKKKKREHKTSHDDLWVDPTPRHVPAISLTIPPPVCSPLPSSLSCDSILLTVPDACTANEESLYLVVRKYPSSQSKQLPLTPGDIIVVHEKAENGWWRGTAKGDDRSVWFSSSYVVPVKQDGVQPPSNLEPGEGEEEGGESQTSKPRISSFLIRKKQGNRSLRENNSFSLRKMNTQVTTGVSRSASALNPVPPVRLAPTSTICTDDFSTSVRDKYYKVLFAYKAAYRGELSLREGEVIQGRETDQNGWILGKKLHSKEEGWFPAVYVDQMTGDLSSVDKLGVAEGAGDRRSLSQLDHDVYGLLAVNRNKSPDQSWVGIEHRVSRNFSTANETDDSTQMSLREGDTVTVVEALDSGWWLGYHGDQVGWFPGDHVELMEEKLQVDLDAIPIPLKTCSSLYINNNTLDISPASKRSSLASSVDSRDLHDKKPGHTLSRESMLSDVGDRPRPARKAPAPPLPAAVQRLHASASISGTSTLSRNPRPMRPAPAPPLLKPRCESVGSADRWISAGKLAVPGSNGVESEVRVATPRKQRKPKVVRVPKERLGLDKISSCPAPSCSPPSATASPSLSPSPDESSSVSNQPVSDTSEDVDSVVSKGDASEQEPGSETNSQKGSENVESDSLHSANTSVAISSHSSEENIQDLTDCRKLCADDKSQSRNSSEETLVTEECASNDSVPTATASVGETSLSSEIFHNLSTELAISIPGLTTGSASPEEEDGNFTTVSNSSDTSARNSRVLDDTSYSDSRILDDTTVSNPVSSEDTSADDSRTADDTFERSPDSTAYVETSPTLHAPPPVFPVMQTESCDDSEKAASKTPENPPHKDSEETSPMETESTQDPSVVKEQLESVCNREEQGDTKVADTGPGVAHSLTDNMLNPLMVGVRTSSPITTPMYIPPPSILLEDADESSVDDLQPSGQSSPASSETSSRSSSSSKPTGYWKFHSGTNGHNAKPKPTKLTKVAPPVVPRTTKSSEEGLVEVPPAGMSGRVHKIVHQINRMASVEEQPGLPRRPSLQHHSAAHSDPIVEQTKDSHQQSSDSVKSTSPQTAALFASSSHHSDEEAESRHPPTIPETLPNGRSVSELSEPSSVERPTANDLPDVILSSEPALAESTQRRPSDSDEQRSRSQSREGTPDSDGDGQSRRQSSKKIRAPLPPTSLPPSMLRNMNALTVAEQQSTEC